MTSPARVRAHLNTAGTGEIGTANQRAERRAEIRRRVLEVAEREAYRTHRSHKCGELRHHAGDPIHDGCRNDGSTCICECHDPKRTP